MLSFDAVNRNSGMWFAMCNQCASSLPLMSHSLSEAVRGQEPCVGADNNHYWKTCLGKELKLLVRGKSEPASLHHTISKQKQGAECD